jgi:type IV pilus assembly protein PilA
VCGISNNKKGFSLIELVIVIVVMAILAAIAIPVVTHTVNIAVLSATQSNAETLNEQLMLAKADVDTGNTNTYGTDVTDGSLTIGDVVKKQAITDACKTYVYQGNEIAPVWNSATSSVEVMYTASNKNVETGVTITSPIRITENSTTLISSLS